MPAVARSRLDAEYAAHLVSLLRYITRDERDVRGAEYYLDQLERTGYVGRARRWYNREKSLRACKQFVPVDLGGVRLCTYCTHDEPAHNPRRIVRQPELTAAAPEGEGPPEGLLWWKMKWEGKGKARHVVRATAPVAHPTGRGVYIATQRGSQDSQETHEWIYFHGAYIVDVCYHGQARVESEKKAMRLFETGTR